MVGFFGSYMGAGKRGRQRSGKDMQAAKKSNTMTETDQKKGRERGNEK